MDSLASHLDSWSQLIDEYGQKSVMHCPEQVRAMLLEILPDGLEDELDHPLNTHIKTHEQIIEWCEARTTKSRQKALAAQRLRQAVPGRMQPLVAPDVPKSKPSDADVDAPPAWFEPFINMVSAFEQGNRGRPSARADSPGLLEYHAPHALCTHGEAPMVKQVPLVSGKNPGRQNQISEIRLFRYIRRLSQLPARKARSVVFDG